MLAELHSLYVLDTLAETWKINAPYPNWTDYATAIREYYNNRIDDCVKIANDRVLSEFFSENVATWEKDSYDGEQRRYNALSAVFYAKVISNNVYSWQALKKLHGIGRCDELSFEQYLKTWHDNCVGGEKGVVEKIAGVLGISLK
jgi:hypothetical protein